MKVNYYEGWYENIQSDEFEDAYRDMLEEDFEDYDDEYYARDYGVKCLTF